MKIFFDTEFIEDGHTIELLSVGLVRDDGAVYYAEPAETDRTRADEWVALNVLPHLEGPILPRSQIAQEIVKFCGPTPEFWAYFSAHDWVALTQLYGKLIDHPAGWPMRCNDIAQFGHMKGVRKLPAQTSTKHHALADAMWNRRAYEYIRGFPA